MKLEVGEFYLSASGEVIEIIIKRSNMFEDVYLNSFFDDGICNGDIRDFDLIAHIPKELHFDIIKTIKSYHSDNRIKEYIDYAYNNKENRSCSNCKYIKKYNEEVWECKKEVRTLYHTNYIEHDFCCNKWENKQ